MLNLSTGLGDNTRSDCTGGKHWPCLQDRNALLLMSVLSVQGLCGWLMVILFFFLAFL